MLKNIYLNFCRYSINTYWAQFGNVFLWTAHCMQGLLGSMIHKSCWFLCFLFEGLFLLQVFCKQLLLFLQNIWCDCSVLSLKLTKASDCRKLCILLCVCVRARVRMHACVTFLCYMVLVFWTETQVTCGDALKLEVSMPFCFIGSGCEVGINES